MVSRRFLLQSLATAALLPSVFCLGKPENNKSLTNRYDIALSQWSFHRAILGDSKKNYTQFIKALHSNPNDVLMGELDTTDIVIVARKLGVSQVDLVNILFFGYAKNEQWLSNFKSKAENEGVNFNLLMCDE